MFSAAPAAATLRTNVADRLMAVAQRLPDAVAVACPGRGDVAGQREYASCTFRELDADATALARGLAEAGVAPGMRMVLLVTPGVEFVKLVFALLRTGAITVLVDPGMGRRHLLDCLQATDPHGFVAVSVAQAVRRIYARRFPRAELNVTVGRRWFWGGATYRGLLRRGRQSAAPLPTTRADDPAAIVFTSGSTGPPKGVLYTHGMFDAQARDIADRYALSPGGADLSCFPLFGLFNSAMGVTTVFPEMDFSRPATADPAKLLAAANDWQVTQAFASPAVWDKLSRYLENQGERINTLRKVFSCGAPVPAAVLRRTLGCVSPDAQMHTPYGATESLPVATIDAAEVLGETAERTDAGAGVCVGRKFDSIEWRVIRIAEQPIASIDDAEELPAGEIGELIVRGPQVSPAYVVDPEDAARIAATAEDALRPGRLADTQQGADVPRSPANASSKISDNGHVWHRIGDVGYFDEQQRFWYCGRKAHRVTTTAGVLFTIPVEAAFNTHPDVRRAALVGVGPAGSQTPLICIEPAEEFVSQHGRDFSAAAYQQLLAELTPLAARSGITRMLLHPRFPVDVRHNSKIRREDLAAWAAEQ